MNQVVRQINRFKYLIKDPKDFFITFRIYILSHTRNYKKLLDALYYLNFHKKINWDGPEDLNQWINFLVINSDITKWGILADKYEVKNFLRKQGLEEILIPMLANWAAPEDISFENLPDEFVLKLNNGSGDAIFIKDKNKADLPAIKSYFKECMHAKYGKMKGELHYLLIPPMIIAEETLNADRQAIPSSSLIDYKFWCFNGRVVSCMVCANRKKEEFQIALYSVADEWRDISSGNLVYSDCKKPIKIAIPKPKSLGKMVEVASMLSKGYPQMRVDLYEVNDKPYFGEITMTSFGGRIKCFSQSYLKELGNCVKEAYSELNGCAGK